MRRLPAADRVVVMCTLSPSSVLLVLLLLASQLKFPRPPPEYSVESLARYWYWRRLPVEPEVPLPLLVLSTEYGATAAAAEMDDVGGVAVEPPRSVAFQ